jgi:hypothetical protein
MSVQQICRTKSEVLRYFENRPMCEGFELLSSTIISGQGCRCSGSKDRQHLG